jgi:hypothetical protein
VRDTQNDLQVADALRLAHYGTPSFPCREDKRPACPHGFKDATADPERLREVWRQYPGALVGVPTGQPSGIFVVDIDSARHDEANDWLERHSPYLPETRQHATKSGGWHLLFKHRAGLKNSTSKLAKGVDTRGEGGYIIWWPFHMGLNAPHKLELPIADLPDEIHEQLVERLAPAFTPRPLINLRQPCHTPHPETIRARLEGLAARIRDAREGERNSILFWCANRVCDMAREGEIDTPATSRALYSLVTAAFQRGLSAKEIQSTVNSATRGQR